MSANLQAGESHGLREIALNLLWACAWSIAPLCLAAVLAWRLLGRAGITAALDQEGADFEGAVATWDQTRLVASVALAGLAGWSGGFRFGRMRGGSTSLRGVLWPMAAGLIGLGWSLFTSPVWLGDYAGGWREALMFVTAAAAGLIGVRSLPPDRISAPARNTKPRERGA